MAGSRRNRAAGGGRLDRTPRVTVPSTDAARAPAPGPLRTCVGCRVRCRDVQLLRVVAVAGTVVPDPRRRLPGRGAWLHPDPGCFAAACKRRAFGRALRAGPDLDATPVLRYLQDAQRIGTVGVARDPRRRPAEQGNEVDPS